MDNRKFYLISNSPHKYRGLDIRKGINVYPEELNLNAPFSFDDEGFILVRDFDILRYEHIGHWLFEVEPLDNSKIQISDVYLFGRTDAVKLIRRLHMINDFPKWYRGVDLEKYSYILAKKFSKYFDIWFNSQHYNWQRDSYALAQYCSNQFHKWFNPNKYNMEYSAELVLFCADYFDDWFNINSYNWEDSWVLAQFLPDKFKSWFNPDYFNWEDSGYLAQYCSQYFDDWFNPTKYNWAGASKELAQYCSNQFRKWFNPDTFNWDYRNYLVAYCSEYFTEWFIPERFSKYDINKFYFKLFVPQYESIWKNI